MNKTAFTLFIDGKKYLTINTTADRIKSKAIRLHYRDKNATSITVVNNHNQVIFTI